MNKIKLRRLGYSEREIFEKIPQKIPDWVTEETSGSGYGSGSGSGYGDGDGYGYGYGSGSGDGYGYGDGEDYYKDILLKGR